MSIKHISGSMWECVCGEILNLLEPTVFLSRETELARLIETQNDELYPTNRHTNNDSYEQLVFGTGTRY